MTGECRMPLIAALKPLADRRRPDWIVVTCMGSTREWPPLCDHPLDFHHIPSAMGGAVPLALGMALAQPRREVIVFTGDGSLLMNLGCLVTITAAAPPNLSVVLLDNGVYEVTGGQLTPGRRVDYSALAAAAGFAEVASFHDQQSWQDYAGAADFLPRPGPRFIHLSVEPVRENYVAHAPRPPLEQVDRFRRACGLGVQVATALMSLIAAWALLFPAPAAAQDEERTAAVQMEQDFRSTVRPLMERYCHSCHAGDVTEAEIDLAAFRSVDDVRQGIGVWLKIREMLDSGQMPPQDAEQPGEEERTRLVKWVRRFLAAAAAANDGDPGPVALRRVNNAEYAYTIRDLTGVESLHPTSEFPVDGAAGEGFTNVGSGQGMSPALLRKYLDAAKEVAAHAVLLPDGLRFSPSTARRDHTNEILARIQEFYRRFTDDGGGAAVDLQGIKFETNQGGLLPLQAYLSATLAERGAIAGGEKTIDDVARQRSLSARYLRMLWMTLADESKDRHSLLIGPLQEAWRRAEADQAPELAAEINQWQQALWKFNPVGHIGREGGSPSWMEAVSPITDRQEIRFKLPDASPGADVVIYLVAGDLGDGNEQDIVVWQRPRIEFKGGDNGPARRPILLRDVQPSAAGIESTIARESARTTEYLDAWLELRSLASKPRTDKEGEALSEIADRRKLNPVLLQNWAVLCEWGGNADRGIAGRFTEKLTRVQGYAAINGWGSHQTPCLLTNRSDEPISFLTLTVPARGVTVHPSPEVESVVAWRSPLAGRARIEGRVADTDNQCGNGASWRVEHASAEGTNVLAGGVIDNGGEQAIRLEGEVALDRGDVVSLIVGARDKDHVCDTTHIDLTVIEVGGQKSRWNLASDVVDNVLDGNPLPDSYGHGETWHFCGGGEPAARSPIAPGSALARWKAAVAAASPREDTARLAAAVQSALTAEDDEPLGEPDRALRRRLLDWRGPLDWVAASSGPQDGAKSDYGLDPGLFGKHAGAALPDSADLCLAAPRMLEVRLPGSLVAGGEFVATAALHAGSGRDGSVQLQVLAARPREPAVVPAAPILVGEAGAARRRCEEELQIFRELFPPALCYARIVPVDEVVTLTLFHREDDHLKRLMLSDEEAAQLDRLWNELYYVSQEPLKLVVALEQITEFATQDRPDLVKTFVPLKKKVSERAEGFRARLLETEPAHVRAAVELADRAWRRPLTGEERQELRDLYGGLRDSEISHEDAIRLVLARVLTSPAFLYKLEQAGPGKDAAPVTNLELSVRLSYFLWSSAPDEELRRVAEAGELTNGAVLLAQTHRMLADPRARRLAIEFACQWLHVRNFDQAAEKNERLYPDFAGLRHDMYEETVRFWEDLIREDGSILAVLDADHTFLNEPLARHYGIDGLAGTGWQRVDGIRSQGRGGVLGMAAILAGQSGASRTSPILRGNWVFETLLGERLPRPPAGVPQLPEAVPDGLTARELIERHSSSQACAKCHARIDPYGFALEQFDAVGRLRPEQVDTKTTLSGGRSIEGLDGLRAYLLGDRRHDFVRQFCRKLLGYSLGRETLLSDEPLIDRMMDELALNDYRFSAAVETIVASRQFCDIRGALLDP